MMRLAPFLLLAVLVVPGQARAQGLTQGLAPSAGQVQARLTIHVRGVEARGGILRLGLYDRARYRAEGEPLAFADVPARAPETVIVLAGVAPGEYAIETYQDANANDKMEQNWLGLPLEPYGFSRDAKPFLSRPGFDAVKITLTAGENVQTVHLQNSDGK
jgi:uncharacterized protein (DUF2141 family)